LKFFIYIFYFFRSLFLRGGVNTLKLIFEESKNESLYGIKTSSLKKSNSTDYFHYQGAGYLILFRIFEKIYKQTHNYTFVDIGCGMGRPCFVAESYGYKNITGIDLDLELINEAKLNLTRRLLKNKSSKIDFIHVNAMEYNYKNEPTVYFLFNPFNESVLKNVLAKIIEQTQSETWFVYMNPIYSKTFTAEKFEFVSELRTKRYLEAIIYKLKN
jgi:SAM-dependent methyltransferase